MNKKEAQVKAAEQASMPTVVSVSCNQDAKREICPVCGETLRNDPTRNGVNFCPKCGKIRKAAPPDIRPGNVIGNYKILKNLARGGMGTLFLCCPRDDLSKRYALKMLRMELGDDQEICIKRFKRESALLSRLNHDSIVKVYESWHDAYSVYIVMEYINGSNLEQLRLQNRYDFNEAVAIQIMSLLADALNYAWEELRLLHRDIKPSNIMIDERGHIRLLDFGIAKSLNSVDTTVLTVHGHGLGTPGYMSPEQFRNTEHLTCTTDIYSLGATIYFLLTGKPPFTGKNPTEVFNEMLSRDPVPVHKINPAVSENFSILLQKTLNRVPAKRPFSWRKLLVDLERVQSGKPPLRD